MDTQRDHILAKDANRNFFKHVKIFDKAERPELFHVRTIIQDKSDQEVSEVLAEYFKKVSQEFDPLEPCQIPRTKSEALPILATWEVAIRIKKFRKPKSMVKGDVFPSLVTLFADFFCGATYGYF